MLGLQDGLRPAELAVLAVLKAASAPTIRAPSDAWKGTRSQQDLYGWAAATEVTPPRKPKFQSFASDRNRRWQAEPFLKEKCVGV